MSHHPSLPLFIHSIIDQGRCLAGRFTGDPEIKSMTKADSSHVVWSAVDPAPCAISWRTIGQKKYGGDEIALFKRSYGRTGREEDNGSISTDAAPPKMETWFARRSLHEDVSGDDNITFQEFKEGLLAFHSEHEKEYTPDVTDAHQVLSWVIPNEVIVNGYRDIRISGMRFPPLMQCSFFPQACVD